MNTAQRLIEAICNSAYQWRIMQSRPTRSPARFQAHADRSAKINRWTGRPHENARANARYARKPPSQH